MISSQKNFQANRSFLRPPKFPPKFGSDPFKGEKKCSDFGVHGIQSNRPACDSRFQHKNRF